MASHLGGRRRYDGSPGGYFHRWEVEWNVLLVFDNQLPGILSGSTLMIKLAEDRVLPHFISKTLPVTRAPYVAIGAFLILVTIVYASAAANLNTLSQMSVHLFFRSKYN